MYENLGTTIRKARKNHKCDWCEKVIQKGEQYEYQKFVYDGDMCDWKAHLACSRVASAIYDYVDPDEGMTGDEFADGCQEVCQRFICPDCPKWNKEFEECKDDESYCIDKMDAFFQTHELYKDRSMRTSIYKMWKCREKEQGN